MSLDLFMTSLFVVLNFASLLFVISKLYALNQKLDNLKEDLKG